MAARDLRLWRLGCALGLAGVLGVALACGLTVTGGAESPETGSEASAPDAGAGAVEGGAADCPTGVRACAGSCVDMSNDPDHCGTCGSKCGPGLVCSLGACTAACGVKDPPCTGVCCTGFCAAGACKRPVFWLRSDVGVTTAPTFVWADQSGNGSDVSQVIPAMTPVVLAAALSGRSVLRFASARLEGPDVQGFRLGVGDFAWFHVSRNLGTGADPRNQVFGTIRSDGPGSPGITAGFGSKDEPYGMLRNDSEVWVHGDAGSVSEWGVIDLRRLDGTVQLRHNGVALDSEPSTQDVSGGAIVVGVEGQNGTQYLHGDVAEIIVFAGRLSDAERQAVVDQLRVRYGFTF